MKKIILVIMTIFLFVACHNTTDDVRKIKKGMSENELKEIVGNPDNIKFQPGFEEWTYYYWDTKVINNHPGSAIVITVINNKVINFYSY